MILMRSWLFVPGQRQRMIAKALATDVDVVLLDLEDAVPLGEKPHARTAIAAALSQFGCPEPASQHHRPLRFVRINTLGSGHVANDLDAVIRPGLDGLCLPKVDSAERIHEIEFEIAERERRTGIPVGTLQVVVAIESAAGLLNAPTIGQASSRTIALMFGAEDFGNDIGLPAIRVAEASELVYARSAIVVAAASARIAAIDGVWPVVRDTAGLTRDAIQARRLGFAGKALIHPDQVDVINAVFRPDAGEIERAKHVVATFEHAVTHGTGAIALDGQLVDLPVVERARRTLEIAATIDASSHDANRHA